MSQKASQSKKKASSKGTRFALQLTRRDLFIWLGVAFLVVLWMFILGVIVGRGLSPVRFDVERLKKELIALKQEALKREEATSKMNMDTLSRKRDLDFYDLLTDKKEQARLKSISKGEQKPLKPSLVKKGPARGSFTLQVLAVKDSTRAKKMLSYLKGKGYGAYEVTVHMPGEGTYHRVRVGHFKDRHEATRTAARLRDEKLEPIVIRE